MDDMTSQGYEGGQKIMMEQIRHEIETIEKVPTGSELFQRTTLPCEKMLR
jgi:hypothetical protein